MKGMKQMDLASNIRNIPDFPKAGIQFKDITTLLKNKDAFRQAVDSLFHLFDSKAAAIVLSSMRRSATIWATDNGWII
jgi:adenine phosphoribosyltransferase